MRQTLHKLQTTIDDEKSVGEMQGRACEIAAICRATFDVDAEDHISALLSSSADVAILVECSIVIHDYTPPSGTLPANLQKLLRRDCRLAHFLEPRLATLIRANRGGLDDAIASVWPSYRPRNHDQWQHLSDPNKRWVTSFTDQSGINVRVRFILICFLGTLDRWQATGPTSRPNTWSSNLPKNFWSGSYACCIA